MNWFIHSMKNYANFAGRARRREYCWFQVVSMGVIFILFIAALLSILPALGPRGSISGSIALSLLWFALCGIFTLAIAVPSWAVLVRRLHDIGASGWFSLLAFVPCVGGIFLIAISFIDGNAGRNQYGPDPKDRSSF